MGINVSSTAKVNIGFKVYGCGNVKIGDNTWIGPNCSIYTAEDKEVSIGNYCDIAPDVSFVCGSHAIGNSLRRAGEGSCHGIVVNDGVWICTKTTVLCANVGRGVVIGAGSMVVKDVEDDCLVAGVPAVVKKKYI